uniref:COX assembly mitochondrial protein n=1 Tax=Pseudictyota dubia TaxID=2749911 RepID=A0A7R9WFT0_9STRA|mmetsp:Transcript_49042/g.90863  ORF Transcript_49042/g.90863 Transcript_49042/m.90863 type:complete len:117 (+) Transcript_49042:143-493(+)
MHPPLDRPHPDCHEEIDALRTCQATNSKLKFWACNEIKFAMDKCLRAEKKRLLANMNRDFEDKRQREEDAYRDAVGQELTFDEYLKKDPEYVKAAKDAEERKKKYPDLYARKVRGS